MSSNTLINTRPDIPLPLNIGGSRQEKLQSMRFPNVQGRHLPNWVSKFALHFPAKKPSMYSTEHGGGGILGIHGQKIGGVGLL